MYIIRATKANTLEFVDVARFRSLKKAEKAIVEIKKELANNLDDGSTIKGFLGIYQFTHSPKKGSPIVYHIAVD